MDLSKKNFHLILTNLQDENWRENESISIIQKSFFKKEISLELQVILQAACSGQNIIVNAPIVYDLINCLYDIFTSNLSTEIKAAAFRKFLQAFTKVCSTEESAAVLQFFLVLTHLLGLEQRVQFLQSSKPEDPPQPFINKKHFEEAFNVSCIEPCDTSYVIVKSLIEELSNFSPNLNVIQGDVTYLQWFQSFVLVPLSSEKLTNVQLNFFCACADFNTLIIEKRISKLLSHLLSQSLKRFKNDEFVKSFEYFMENMLKMYSKLQRIQKFIEKLLSCIRNTKSNLSLRNLFSENFVGEFSNIITLLPSVQSLSFMDELLNALDEHCVKTLEENSDNVNTLIVQVICALLSAFLRGVKILSHTTLPAVMKSFLEKMQQLKDILGRFGKSLLIRIHDREIVQPFLNLCFYWGEFELMVAYYAPEYSEQMMNKDISPTDLSALHSYLNGEEWNVLAERVSNFGAVQCYQSFLKLILQKLRTLQLKKPHTSINGEATSKYVLTLVTCELYKHDIIEELTPEDFTIMLSYLTQRQSHSLIDKLYTQVLEKGNGDCLLKWLRDSLLLENRDFIILSIVIVFNKLGGIFKNMKVMAEDGVFDALLSDFFDESYNIVQGDLEKLIQKLNELLKYEFIILNKDKNLDLLLDILKCLPLVHLSTEVSSVLLSGLVFLAVAFSKSEEYLNPLLHFICKLSKKTGKRETFNNFNIGLAVSWLLQIDPKLGDARNNLLKLLLKKGMGTDKGRSEISNLVKNLRKRKFEDDSKSLEYQITLYQSFGKSWAKTKGGNEENEEIMKYRKKLSKRIRQTLESQSCLKSSLDNPEVLVNAYNIELIRVLKLKKQDDLLRLIQLNFENFFDISLTKVKAGSVAGNAYHTFLSNVLINFPSLKQHLHKNSLRKIWNSLKLNPNVDWKLFYKITDEEDFEFFMGDLLKTWKVFQMGKLKKMNVECYFNIWKEFYSCENVKKKKLYETHLKYLFIQFSVGLASIMEFGSEEIVQLFDFLRFCISTAELTMTSPMIDTAFDMMYEYEYRDEITVEEFKRVFGGCVNAASWLLSTRKVRTRDKIHNIFLLFTKLLNRLIRKSTSIPNATEEELTNLSTCSHRLEKWTSKMVMLSKDFSRMSVYFIAAVVTSFVKVGIYPVVKTSLVNCIYKFLSISDPHNIAHLSMVLNPGSQQIFNGIYTTYKKYYKFRGKV